MKLTPFLLNNAGIRDHIISKSKCVCGVSVLADDLLPNKTLRDTINRILESGNSSAENAGSTFQVQGWFVFRAHGFCAMLCGMYVMLFLLS